MLPSPATLTSLNELIDMLNGCDYAKCRVSVFIDQAGDWRANLYDSRIRLSAVDHHTLAGALERLDIMAADHVEAIKLRITAGLPVADYWAKRRKRVPLPPRKDVAL